MPFDVQMPDGTIIKGVPEGTTQSELMRRLTRKIEAMPTPKKQEATFSEGFLRSFVDRAANNILGIPDAVVTGFANMPSPVNLLAPLAPPGTEFRDRRMSVNAPTLFEDITGNKPPQMGESVLPVPTARDIRATADVIETGKPFGEAKKAQIQREQTLAKEAPTGVTLGNLAADGVSILMGRKPFVRAAAKRRVEKRIIERLDPTSGVAKHLKQAREQLHAVPRDIQSKVIRNLKKPFKTEAFKKLSRGAGKAAEAGFEGAFLSMLHRGDPFETAVYSAAAQAGGSTFLSLLPKSKTGLGTAASIGAAALAYTVYLQTFKSAAPGGKNRILESIESGFEHVTIAMALGLAVGIAGGGRLPRGSTWEDFPVAVDAVTTIPRGMVISMIEQAINDNRIEPVLKKLSEEPNYFGPQASRKLQRSMRDKRMSFSGTLDKLMKNADFKRKFDQIAQ